MSIIVENTNPVTVDIESKHSVTTQSGAIVENKAPEYSVSVQRKEYKVVGDNIYIPRLHDDAPQWMKDLVNTVVDVKTAVAVGNLDDALEALRTLSDELEVAKNTYTNSIISSNDIDQRINTAIETLNSALSDADATIMNIAQTATTPAEASAIALNTLSASLSASGEIGSFISNMNSAFADLDSATTQSINFMESAINAEFSANATALNTIRTYVGIDDAGASTGTGLSAYLEDSAGNIGGADSQLANTIRVTAEGVESKFAYNSVVNINGIYKKSGFGLTTNYTSGNGTEIDPYVSEFWVDASRLKFTNSNATGQVAPFTIDASGITPEITFNGKVSFSNVTGYTPADVSGDINANNDVFAQRLGYADYAAMVAAASSGQTIINGGYINTLLLQANSIIASKINTTGLIAENINATEIVGKTFTGTVINGAKINGAVIKASYLDLDGDLEILTNYHITVAMYNANPSLYTDAVYISADNEYRIPSISIIKETDSVSSGNGCSIYGIIRSYNTANAGHNNKAVKIRPYFIISENITLFKTYYATEDTRKTQRGILYLGNILLIDASMSNDILTINGINYDMPDTDPNSSTARSASITLTRYGLSITVSAVRIGSGGGLFTYSNSGLSIVLNATTGVYLDANFEDTTRGFYIKDLSSAYSNEYSKSSCSISSKIAINNMI